jgi:type I restriction enzyme R subunit
MPLTGGWAIGRRPWARIRVEEHHYRPDRALRNHVESHEDTIARKAKIVIEHFHSPVINGCKIRSEVRGMVVTQGIHRAIYWLAVNRELPGRGQAVNAHWLGN